jgi:hypothetical protein
MKILSTENLSKKMTNILSLAIDAAENVDTGTPYRHGAVLFKNSNNILNVSNNCQGDSIYGYRVPACHAEANALHYLNTYYGRRRWRVLPKAKGANKHVGNSLAKELAKTC